MRMEILRAATGELSSRRWCGPFSEYDGLARGELGHTMPASSSPPSSRHHRIAILVSPVGRLLQCRDCKLTFVFSDEAHYGTIAKQFEPHLCYPPICRPGWRTDSRFVIVRYDGKVPAMASCAKCERKFFTPAIFARDATGAEEYLGHKFELHVCVGIEEKRW